MIGWPTSPTWPKDVHWPRDQTSAPEPLPTAHCVVPQQRRLISIQSALLDQRLLLKRDIDMHFLCFRHTVLPPAQRWISLLMHYAETHLWEDSERAGDIWNGRWSTHLLRELLIEHSDSHIPPADYSTAMLWLSNLTLTLQKTQTALYSTRRHILRQMGEYKCNPPPTTTQTQWSSNSDTLLCLEYSVLSRNTPSQKAAPIPRKM